MSQLLTEPLELYLTDVEYGAAGNETPYLFHPKDDAARCVTSSQWSAMVKAVLKKHTGKAAPPKLLRASFITYAASPRQFPALLLTLMRSAGGCATPPTRRRS